MRPILALSRAPHAARPSSPWIRRATLRRVLGPLITAAVVAGATVTAVLGGSAAGAMAASAAGAIAASAGGNASGSAGEAVATDPFQAGEQGAVDAPVSAAVAATEIARATTTGAVLGLPIPTRRTATRVVDRFAGRTYDEVTDYGAGDRPIALQRFDTDGRLLAAVRFGWHGDGGATLPGAAGARLRAQRIATTLGFDTAGVPRVAAAPSDAGWTVAWDRMVGGIPVPGDGLRIQLWTDGTVHGLTRSERPLASRPSAVLEEARVRSIVAAHLDGWFRGDTRRDVTLTGLTLAWVPPNDTFAAAAPDAPAAVLRLAWVARATTSGPLAEGLRAIEIYLDAGDGSIIGGDVLE